MTNHTIVVALMTEKSGGRGPGMRQTVLESPPGNVRTAVSGARQPDNLYCSMCTVRRIRKSCG